jgi:hypothetical protein
MCNVQTLLSEANCFTCVPPGTWPLLKLALLCLIAQSGGSGGGVQQVYGPTPDPPVAPPTNPLLPALAYTSGGTLYNWNGSAWV